MEMIVAAARDVLRVAMQVDEVATYWLQRDVILGKAELLLVPGSKGFGWGGFPFTLSAVAVMGGRQRLV